MKETLGRIAQYGISGCWSLFAGLILVLLLCFSANTAYNGKRVFSLSYGWLLLIGLLILIAGTALYLRFKQRIDTFWEKLPGYTILILSAALFLFQAFIFYNMYFEAGWDSSYIVSIARRCAAGETDITAWYFGRYPNNFLMVWIYTNVFRLMSWLGLGAWDSYAVILIQCILSCFCGYLLFKTVRDMTGPLTGYFAWFIYVLHVGLSPWLSILYSDPLVLCVPMLVLRLYQLTRNGRFVPLKWAAIGFFSYLSYKVKPQAVFVLYAILIVECVDFLLHINKENIICFLKKCGACAVAALGIMLVVTYLIFPTLPLIYNTESAFSISHYLMMGLNTQDQGGYSQTDVDFSNSFYNKEERRANNIRVAKERICAMGVKGLTTQYARKVLINYGDGSYAWSGEGGFYNTLFDDRNETVSPFLKSIYYRDGSRHSYFLHFQQCLWLTLLFCGTGCILYFVREKMWRRELVVPLSLIGLTVFVTIFEARARYLFCYSPFYIICGVLGWIGIVRAIRRLKVGTFLEKFKKVPRSS